MTREIAKYSPDTIEDLSKTDLVKLSRDLLGKIIENTQIMDTDIEFNQERLKQANTVLGFLNASIGATKAKMHFFRLTGLDEKIKAVKQKSKDAE